MTSTRANGHVIEANNYINGQWVAAKSGATFDSYNPANGQLLGRLAKSGPLEVDAAVSAARAAFDKWRRHPAPRRGEILFRVGALLAERKEQISRLMTREMGKVLTEARGDVQEGIDMA